jgi:1-phosphofructokinase
VVIEPIDGAEGIVGDVHLHPGGQGFWIARMLRRLGEWPVLCAPVGGEAGRALRVLIPDWELDFRPVFVDADSPVHVHDRRSGRRTEIACDPAPVLDRHETDDLFGRVLELSLATRVCVATGRPPGGGIPVDVFTRLGRDLESGGVRVVADMHGPELDAWLDGGPIDVLKVSDEDLAGDGRLASEDETAIVDVIVGLVGRGARSVVVSRADRGAVAMIGGDLYRARPPVLSVVDAIGSGDSMTGALTCAFLAKLDPEDMLRMATAAGAANVTRHGLATGSADLVRQLAHEVAIERIEPR